MKKKYIYIALTSVLSIVVIMGTLLFGTHIGKTVTEEKMKGIDNEMTYNVDDIEGVWLAEQKAATKKGSHTSYEFVKFEKNEDGSYSVSTDVDTVTASKSKLFNDEDRDWNEYDTFDDMEYNSKTRSINYVSTSSETDKRTQGSINVGLNFEHLTMTETTSDGIQREYSMIRPPKAKTSDYDEVSNESDLTNYYYELFEF